MGCPSFDLLSASCLIVSATKPDPNCLGPPQPPEAPSSQGLEHNSLLQARPDPTVPSWHVRSAQSHPSTKLSASIPTGAVGFLSVGTRVGESSGQALSTGVSVTTQKWPRMGGQARLGEAPLRRAKMGGAKKGGKDQWGFSEGLGPTLTGRRALLRIKQNSCQPQMKN